MRPARKPKTTAKRVREDETQNDEPFSRRSARSDRFTLGVRVAVTFDLALAAVNAAMILGVVVLLLRENLSASAGALLFLSAACFLWSGGNCLMHLRFMTQLLLLADRLESGDTPAPRLVEWEGPELDACARIEGYATHSSSSQVLYLVTGVALAALALAMHLWAYAWRAGVIALALFILMSIVIGLSGIRKKAREKRRPRTPRLTEKLALIPSRKCTSLNLPTRGRGGIQTRRVGIAHHRTMVGNAHPTSQHGSK